MLIDSSIHNHTTFCDGKSTPEEMIESAYRAGFKDFGVLCHATMTSGNYDWPVRDEKGFIDCVKKLKENVGVPIHLHTHNTAGIGDMTNLMAAWAGVDIVDCALSPLGNGTSQPATEALVLP